jgi:hypothetical protein
MLTHIVADDFIVFWKEQQVAVQYSGIPPGSFYNLF